MNITITPTKGNVNPETINIAPFFEHVPLDEEIVLDFSQVKEGGSFRYFLPKIDDTPGDSPYILSNTLETFMTYENRTNSILMTNLTKDKVGNYEVRILLADMYNRTREYKININIKDIWPDKPIKIKPISIFLDDFDAISANITKISSTGLVTVKFNRTMNTNFNWTFVNETNTEMYIIPSNDRHLNREDFNLSSLNFTWEIVDFKNDTLSIQIDWNCALCISLDPEFDSLFLNLTNATLQGFFYSP